MDSTGFKLWLYVSLWETDPTSDCIHNFSKHETADRVLFALVCLTRSCSQPYRVNLIKNLFSFVIQFLVTCVHTSQPAETQDGESAFGSDSSSVLDWKPSEPIPAQTTRKTLRAISAQVRERRMYLIEWNVEQVWLCTCLPSLFSMLSC